jgi:hypothetical protein
MLGTLLGTPWGPWGADFGGETRRSKLAGLILVLTGLWVQRGVPVAPGLPPRPPRNQTQPRGSRAEVSIGTGLIAECSSAEARGHKRQ